jgi:DNA modification methylase
LKEQSNKWKGPKMKPNLDMPGETWLHDNRARLLPGDCLERLADVATDSVDLILADPPYGTTRCKWDAVIPFAPMWEQLHRVAKERAAIVMTCAQPFTSALVMSNPKAFRYCWVWQKPKGTGHLNAKRQPMRDSEDIAVFYRKQPTYNPQMSKGPPFKSKAGPAHLATSQTDNYGAYTNKRNENTGTRYPKTVLKMPVVERGTVHPTQKPVALMAYLIRTYTNPGDVVLDFTMGSGTAGVAAIQENRCFVGIEKDPTYFETAKKRIEAATIHGQLEAEPEPQKTDSAPKGDVADG